MLHAAPYTPDPKILTLGEGYWDEVSAAAFPEHRLRFRNDRAAASVGLDTLSPEKWEDAFARFRALPDNLTEPLALRYHGHQFAVYNPHLGDGRGFLFAQVRDDRGRLLDLATKGSGTTPWSRGGDGRLTLKGAVREVLAAEMLEALGVPTSRALSVFETGERLHRSDEPSPTRSGVLVRLGHSHIRFGTFQRLAHARDAERITKLVDFCVEAYYPELSETAGDERFVRFFDRVSAASAHLAARWMAAGFCHGVLNTDNMTVTGESFDYGPWRFVPRFDAEFVAAYFDESGLYAYGRQPSVVLWNLARLADALRIAAPAAPLGASLTMFEDRYDAALVTATLDRLGLASLGEDHDAALASAAWTFIDTRGVDFERFFFDFHGGARRIARASEGPAAVAYEGAEWDDFQHHFELYAPVCRDEDPYFASDAPVTMLIDEVEALWAPIAERDDWSAFERKVADVRRMGTALARARS